MPEAHHASRAFIVNDHVGQAREVFRRSHSGKTTPAHRLALPLTLTASSTTTSSSACNEQSSVRPQTYALTTSTRLQVFPV